MDFLPTTPKDWIQGITILILGAFSLFQVFGKSILGVREQADKADDRLISLLKSTVEELERKVKNLEDQNKTFNTELTRVKSENEVMSRILQGRDMASVEYQQKAMDTMKKVDAVLAIVQTNSTDIKALYGLMERHLQALEA